MKKFECAALYCFWISAIRYIYAVVTFNWFLFPCVTWLCAEYLEWDSSGNKRFLMLTVIADNMQPPKLKALPTNAFFTTINQMFGGSFQLLTIAEYYFVVWTVLSDLITTCWSVARSWEEPPNIWLTVVKNIFVGWALDFGVCMLLKGAVMLPPPQAFRNFFLSAKSDWETGREQKGTNESWVASKELLSSPWFPAPLLTS